MMKYVVGFMFSTSRVYVLMIQKNRPDWQKGRFNGIGGKIESGESPLTAMMREFREETGVDTKPEQWEHRLKMERKAGPEAFTMDVFRCFSDQIWDATSVTDEKVQIIEVKLALGYRTVPNMAWMLPLVNDDRHKGARIRY